MVALRVFAGEGILNHVLSAVGLGFVHTDLLSGEVSAMVAVAITFIWSVFGTNTIIFITGMATLDRDVYEAARVYGAGALTTFIEITIPMLMRFIQFAFILTLITAFTALFSLIFVMTGGGPGYGTTTLEFYVYQQGFQVGVFGYAAAIGIVLFAIVFAVSLAQLADLPQPAGLGGHGSHSAPGHAQPHVPGPLRGRRGHAVPVRVHGPDRVQVRGPVHLRERLLARQLGGAVQRPAGRAGADQLDGRDRRRRGADHRRQHDRWFRLREARVPRLGDGLPRSSPG